MCIRVCQINEVLRALFAGFQLFIHSAHYTRAISSDGACTKAFSDQNSFEEFYQLVLIVNI